MKFSFENINFENINAEFSGKNLKQERLEKKLTQKQLGDLCNMADSAIRRYESGRQKPKIETIKRLADALEIPWIFLTDAVETPPIDEQFYINSHGITLENMSNEQIISYDEKKILFNYRNLNPLGREEALKRISELTELEKYTTMYDLEGNPHSLLDN